MTPYQRGGVRYVEEAVGWLPAAIVFALTGLMVWGLIYFICTEIAENQAVAECTIQKLGDAHWCAAWGKRHRGEF